MCVVTGPAHLGGTRILVGEALHPQLGSLHYLGYQNNPEDRRPEGEGGGNAMLLHFDAAEPMGPANMIQMPGHPGFLEELCLGMDARTFGPNRRRAGLMFSPKVQIFESGIYTVVLASRADLIPDVLDQVGQERRPAINKAIFAWYARHFPQAHIMLACFNNREAGKVAPPLWAWYRPRNPDVLQAPGIDAHDGGPPNMDARVAVDSTVLIGSYRINDQVGRAFDQVVSPSKVPEAFRPFAPTRLRAADFGSFQPNGDYVISVADLASDRPTSCALNREIPPSFVA